MKGEVMICCFGFDMGRGAGAGTGGATGTTGCD